MLFPFVILSLFGAAAIQALLFYKVKNPIIRFAPTALGVLGTVFCIMLFVVPCVTHALTPDAAFENQYFAMFLAIPFSCAAVGGLAALGYIFYLRRREMK